MDLHNLVFSLPGGLFWLWYVYRKSRFHPPPLRLVAVAVLCGMASTFVVLHASGYLADRFPALRDMADDPRAAWRIAYFVVMVGLLEEGAKLLSVRLTVYYSRAFDDVVHGVVFSSAAALGFATVENARYVNWHGPEVLVGRVILSTFGHVLQSMIWGFAMGAERVAAGRQRHGILLAGLLLAAVIHGLYDLLLLYGQMWLALLLLFVLWRIFVGQMALAAQDSPHRPRTSRRVRECVHCHALARGEGRYCGACGRALEVAAGDYCAACLKAVDAADRSCRACGRLLL